MNASVVFRIEKTLEIELYEALKKHDAATYNKLIELLIELYKKAKFDQDEIGDLINCIQSNVHAHIFMDEE